MSALDDLGLIDALENDRTPELLAEAKRRADATADEILLAVDPFEGDYTAANMLRNKIVIARKPYVDHWTGMPIAKGDRYRCLCECDDDGLVTTRHSILSLWIMHVGGDSSFLADATPLSSEAPRP